MPDHPPVRTLLALSTLAAIGANDLVEDESACHWLIQRPQWALHVGDYALAIARGADSRYSVVIGHEDFAGSAHCDVERTGVVDLDVDAVGLDLWRHGPGQPQEVRHG